MSNILSPVMTTVTNLIADILVDNLECPHCHGGIVIDQINCGIFRHGVYKHNMENINPHANKEDCDNLIINNKIYGCGKPFRLIKENEIYKIEICEYI